MSTLGEFQFSNSFPQSKVKLEIGYSFTINLVKSRSFLFPVSSEVTSEGGGAGNSWPGGGPHTISLTSAGATSQHSRQAALTGPAASQEPHYRHSQSPVTLLYLVMSI